MRKILKKLQKRSLLLYTVSFSAIVFLIIIIMGTYIYRFYHQTIYDNFCEESKERLAAIRNRHEDDMRLLDDILVQMMISGSNVEFLLSDDPIKSIRLKEQLYRYLSVSRFFHQIYYYYHMDEYLYNAMTSIELERFIESGLLAQYLPAEEFKELIRQEMQGMYIVPEQKYEGFLPEKFLRPEEEAVLFIRLIEPKKSSTMLFLVPASYYDKLLLGENGLDELRNFYISYQGELIVKREGIPMDQLDDYDTLLLDVEQEQKVITKDCEEYLLTRQTGESGLLYSNLTPMKIFQQQMFAQQWGILFLLLVLSIPASFLTMLLFRNLSSRISKIGALLNDEEDACRNLEGIESGIRSLVKNHQEIAQENLDFQRGKLINQLIRGAEANCEPLLLQGTYYVVLLAEGRGNHNEAKVLNEILSALKIGESYKGYGIRLISKNQNLFIVFGDSTEELDEKIAELFAIGRDFCETFIMAVSDYETDIKEAANAYLKADTAFDNRFLLDNSKPIFYRMVDSEPVTQFVPEHELQSLRNALRNREEDQVKRVIEEIGIFLQNHCRSLLGFRILCNDIVHMMVSEWKADEGVYSVYDLSQCLTFEDFKGLLLDVCKQLMALKSGVVDDKSELVTKAIAYMKKEYGRSELNMAYLADYLSVSSVTLAIEFKNCMDISPSDYLALIRIEKAKELLVDTQMLIRDISAAVGYEDVNVFNRRFKKNVGMTPGQFRSRGKM